MSDEPIKVTTPLQAIDPGVLDSEPVAAFAIVKMALLAVPAFAAAWFGKSISDVQVAALWGALLPIEAIFVLLQRRKVVPAVKVIARRSLAP